jgi:hypothetical protein
MYEIYQDAKKAEDKMLQSALVSVEVDDQW